MRASDIAHHALVLDPFDARAYHVNAHVCENVCEMIDRVDAGLDWMCRHVDSWARDTVVATHCWWHISLFHLALGKVDRALSLYDRGVRLSEPLVIFEMIDAASLLWRIELPGRAAGRRWRALAAAWAAHVDDAFCTFNDVHAMMAFVGARRWRLARQTERAHVRQRSEPTRQEDATRQVGLEIEFRTTRSCTPAMSQQRPVCTSARLHRAGRQQALLPSATATARTRRLRGSHE